MKKSLIIIVGTENKKFITCESVKMDKRKAKKIAARYKIRLIKTKCGSYFCECKNGFDYYDILVDMGFYI